MHENERISEKENFPHVRLQSEFQHQKENIQKISSKFKL